MVTSVQRFGGALNLHVHFHTLVLDGVFVRQPDDTLVVHPAAPPTDADVHRVVRRVHRRLARLGLVGAPDEEVAVDPLGEQSAALARLTQAAVLGRAALGGPQRPWPPRRHALADACSTLDCRTAFHYHDADGMYHDADGMDPRPTVLARRPRDRYDFRRRRARRLRGDAAVDAAARIARVDRQRRHRLDLLGHAFDLRDHRSGSRRSRAGPGTWRRRTWPRSRPPRSPLSTVTSALTRNRHATPAAAVCGTI